MVNNLMRFKILSIPPIPTLPPNKPELKRQNCYDGTKHSHKNNCINTLNEVIDKMKEHKKECFYKLKKWWENL